MIVLAITSLGGGASAHLGHTITTGERYLKLDATEADTRVVVSLVLGADEGQRLLREADRDGDGVVSEPEAQGHLARWAAGLENELTLAIDGEPADTTWTDGWLEPVGPVGRRAVTVELVAHVPLEGPEHTVVLTDGMVGRERFDRTDVAFRARQGAMLMACGTEREPVGCATQDLGFVRGSALPTRYTARLRFPGRTLPAPFARALRVARDHVTLAAGALLLAGVAVATWNRTRRRRLTSGPPVTGSAAGR